MNIKESWEYLLTRRKTYKKLKRVGYGFGMWIPKLEPLKEMFEKETLTQEDISKYEKLFRSYYDEKHLRRFDNFLISEAKPFLDINIKKHLVPLLQSWGATLPDSLEILCTYGGGGSYHASGKNNKASIVLRITNSNVNEKNLCTCLFHEFVHILIQNQIIEKYKVPQILKERIVDIICKTFLGESYVEQPPFVKSFANNYINSDIIKTDLPGAVVKMMADYNAIQSKAQEVRG